MAMLNFKTRLKFKHEPSNVLKLSVTKMVLKSVKKKNERANTIVVQ